MLVTPSLDDLLEGVIVSLQSDILPNLSNPKAIASLGIAQAVIQMVRQALPVQAAQLVEEHNGMAQVLRDVAAAVADVPGPAAEAIRTRGAELGGKADLPAPLALETIAAAHKELGQALVDTLVDLDLLITAGDERAARGLALLREHLAQRAVRDVQTLLVGAGMIGRG
jgi:hypothetical protein